MQETTAAAPRGYESEEIANRSSDPPVVDLRAVRIPRLGFAALLLAGLIVFSVRLWQGGWGMGEVAAQRVARTVAGVDRPVARSFFLTHCWGDGLIGPALAANRRSAVVLMRQSLSPMRVLDSVAQFWIDVLANDQALRYDRRVAAARDRQTDHGIARFHTLRVLTARQLRAALAADSVVFLHPPPRRIRRGQPAEVNAIAFDQATSASGAGLLYRAIQRILEEQLVKGSP